MARAETHALGSTAVDIKFRAAHSARGDQETTRCHSGTNRLLAIAESASCTSESVDRVEKMIGYGPELIDKKVAARTTWHDSTLCG